MIPTQSGIEPSFSYVQHFVLAVRPPRLHLLLLPFLFYLTLARFGWNYITTMPDIKVLSAEPGIDPGFTHLQHFVLTTRPSRLHLL
jgi:hypothetical protein